MLPADIGQEVRIEAGLVRPVRGGDFKDLPMVGTSKPEVASKPQNPRMSKSHTPPQDDSSVNVSAEVRGTLHQILSKVPPKQVKAARSVLIKLLSDCPQIDFTSKGQLLCKGQPIKNSEVSQIISKIASKKKRTSTILGSNELLNALGRRTTKENR